MMRRTDTEYCGGKRRENGVSVGLPQNGGFGGGRGARSPVEPPAPGRRLLPERQRAPNAPSPPPRLPSPTAPPLRLSSSSSSSSGALGHPHSSPAHRRSSLARAKQPGGDCIRRAAHTRRSPPCHPGRDQKLDRPKSVPCRRLIDQAKPCLFGSTLRIYEMFLLSGKSVVLA